MALKKADGLGAAWALQVAPALVVARIGPDALTAKHVSALGQLIPEKEFVVPDTWVDQVRPLSAERRIMPTSPTLKQIVAVAQLTPVRLLAVPDAPLSQPKPPLLVASIVPESPTRMQWETSAQLTADSEFPCGSGFCQIQVPAPVDMNAAPCVALACPTITSTRLKPTANKRFCLKAPNAFHGAFSMLPEVRSRAGRRRAAPTHKVVGQ